jgi:hypothetical protein
MNVLDYPTELRYINKALPYGTFVLFVNAIVFWLLFAHLC